MFYASTAGLPDHQRPRQHIDHALRTQVKAMEREIHRLELILNALWELARDKLGVDDAQLRAKVREIDLRDGVEDGKITAVPLACPSCGRVSSSKYWRCLYCGLEFERDVIG